MTTRDIYSYSNISDESVESAIISRKRTENKIKIKSTIKEGKIFFHYYSINLKLQDFNFQIQEKEKEKARRTDQV